MKAVEKTRAEARWAYFAKGLEVLLLGIGSDVPNGIVRMHQRDVWIGAKVTALLFTIGKCLIGVYLGKSSFNSAYGAAGSLIVLLLWIYHSAQVFLLGAEFTRVFAYECGSRSDGFRS